MYTRLQIERYGLPFRTFFANRIFERADGSLFVSIWCAQAKRSQAAPIMNAKKDPTTEWSGLTANKNGCKIAPVFSYYGTEKRNTELSR